MLSRLNVETFYVDTEGLELTAKGDNQFVAVCPFHDDHNPSLSIGPRGVFYCLVCHASGSAFDFYMRRHGVEFKEALRVLAEIAGVLIQGTVNQEPLDDSDVKLWEDALWKNQRVLKFLREERGFTDATIKEYRLGWTGERVSIPIFDVDGILVNVRKYKPHAKQLQGKTIGIQGRNEVRLFPATFETWREVTIFEGEPDAILGRQEGFNCVTATLGAGKWDPAWNERFRGCDVVMVLDNDEGGRLGTDQILREHKLADVVKSVRVIQWPKDFKEKGDVTDYLVDQGHSRDALQALIDAAPAWVRPADDRVDDLALTDVGNAKRLVKRHGEDLRYVHVWRSWLRWDGTRWRRDEQQQVQQLAEETILNLRQLADPVIDRELAQWSVRSESNSRINAMVELAESEPLVASHPSRFDREPLLFVCANGTIELATGELREPRRDDLLTRGTSVAFDPAARSEAWEKLLFEVTGGDPELALFLQRAVGYTLTGSTKEEVLFFVHGPTRSGKSTFLEAVKAALGDYSVTANFATFLEQRNAGEAKSDVARLAGARFVVSIEVDEGKKLAEGLIKTLTGGDKITARFMYQEAFEFMLNAKLWLAANHTPRVNDEDDALWRRILLVPFEHTIKNPDPAIKAELLDAERSGPAILAWAVEGCRLWQAQGLGLPAKVADATKHYRAEQNPITEWFDECCVVDDASEVYNQALYQSYLTWARGSGIRFPISSKALTLRLNELGYPTRRGHANKLMRRGLRLVLGHAHEEGEEY